MSTDIRSPAPGDATGLPAGPDAGAGASAVKGWLGLHRAAAVRCAAHLAVWAPFAYALIRAMRGGWRPVSDSAVIALRSWDALTGNGLLVGEATRLAHGVYDPGPLQFWLLAPFVHADPVRGVLWGAAVWCLVAASVAVEAAWATAGELGAALASVLILGIVAWIPGIAMAPSWNPWFGMMFFLAALAAGWAVLSGRRPWWPALVIAGSVAAQAHLMYAVAAACLLLVAFIVVIADSVRAGTYRWAVTGIIAGVACWAAPLVQEFTARTGNLSQLIHAMRAGSTASAGLSFGLRALSAATQPPAYWWRPTLSGMHLATIDQRAAWFGAAQLAVTALVLAVAMLVLRSRRAAALAALSLLTAAAALETYSGIPAPDLGKAPTDLSYLMAPMFPVGALAWLAAGCVLALAAWRAMHRPRAGGAARQPVAGHAAGAVRVIRATWGPRIAGIAVAALMAGLAARAALLTGGPLQSQSAARRAIALASATIEREIPAGRIALAVIAPSTFQRQVTMGLAYALRTDGYTPEIAHGAFQLGPAYHDAGNPGTQVTIFARPHGGVRVALSGGQRVRPAS